MAAIRLIPIVAGPASFPSASAHIFRCRNCRPSACLPTTERHIVQQDSLAHVASHSHELVWRKSNGWHPLRLSSHAFCNPHATRESLKPGIFGECNLSQARQRREANVSAMMHLALRISSTCRANGWSGEPDWVTGIISGLSRRAPCSICGGGNLAKARCGDRGPAQQPILVRHFTRYRVWLQHRNSGYGNLRTASAGPQMIVSRAARCATLADARS